jgi:hypothetical protein
VLAKTLPLFTCAALALGTVGCGVASHYGPKNAVDGSLSKSCDLGCTSPDAARALHATNVWCGWTTGGHVAIHASLENTMAASVKLSITPKYDIKNGGQHGTSFGGDIGLDLAAGETTAWVGDAGTPQGVAAGTPISTCAPHLHDIDIQ